MVQPFEPQPVHAVPVDSGAMDKPLRISTDEALEADYEGRSDLAAEDNFKVVRLVIGNEVIEPEVMELPAGTYVFEVLNDDVEAFLEFAIATKTEGGGRGEVLEASLLRQPIYRKEKAKTGQLTLEPGEYVYYVVDDHYPLHTLTVYSRS